MFSDTPCGGISSENWLTARSDCTKKEKEDTSGRSCGGLFHGSDKRHAKWVGCTSQWDSTISKGKLVRSGRSFLSKNCSEEDQLQMLAYHECVYHSSLQGPDNPSPVVYILLRTVVDRVKGHGLSRSILRG